MSAEEAKAEEWVAPGEAAPAGAAEPDAASERILNQDEIDSLLGFGGAEEDSDDRSGVRAIINSALVSYERLPMLEIVFDRMVRMMTTSLRNLTSDNVEVSLDQITSIRFGDYLSSIPLPAVIAVFRAEQLDNFGLVTVDSNLIYSIIDVLLGGRRSNAGVRVEGRPYTTIERSIVTRMIEVVLGDLKTAFQPLTAVDCHLERIETNPRFAAIARPANAAIVVKLRIDMDDRGGRLELLLPYATLADPQNAAATIHGREIRPRQYLGKPSCRRALADEDRGARGAGHDHRAAQGRARPQGRADADAERRTGSAGDGRVRTHGADARARGPHRPRRRRAD